MTSVVYPKLIKDVATTSGLSRWNQGLRRKLPSHYRNRMIKMEQAHRTGKATPVHYQAEPGYWKPGPHPDTIVPVQNYPIYVMFPKEADEGLWAGEGIVKGLAKKHTPRAPRVPKVWMPHLRRTVLYSEILDKYYKITVSNTALRQIDECFGLDTYILKTSEEDLNSVLALKMRKAMLETLASKSMYPNDPTKCQQIYDKYKQYMTYSSEELEWLGLTEQEAVDKFAALEAEKNKPRPLKEVFAEEYSRKPPPDTEADVETEVETPQKSGLWSRMSGLFKR